jgi:hypothetical protein
MAKLISTYQPTAGDWIIIQKFKKQVRAVLYDPADPNHDPDALGILGWPYSQATPELTFTEIISNKAKAETAVIVNGVDVGKDKFIQVNEYFKGSLIIGTRKERVWTIKKLEQHPVVAEVRSLEKVGVQMALIVTIRVDDPILALTLTNFIGFAENLVIEVFRRWAAKHSIDAVLAVQTNENDNSSTDENPDPSKTPHIPDDICAQIEELNESTLIQHGIQVPHVAVIKVDYSPDSADYLESEQSIGKEKNKVLANVETQKIKIAQNVTQRALNETEIKFLRDKANIEIDVIDKTSTNIAAQNAAWGGKDGLRTLIFNGDKNQQNPQQTIQVASA